MRWRWKALAGAVAVALVAGGGAASYGAATAEHPAAPPAASGAPGGSPEPAAQIQPGQPMGSFRADQPFDLQFIDQMTMHHAGAIMSTRNMIANSSRPELRQLADDIINSQTAQIDQCAPGASSGTPTPPPRPAR